MLTYARDPRLTLIEASDFENGTMPESAQKHSDTFTELLSWARMYLASPHPELGREGPVCPYVHGSLQKRLFFLAVFEGTPDAQQVHDIVLLYRDWFLELEPQTFPSAQLKTILIAFPDLKNDMVGEIVEQTQEKLKPSFVAEGLMVGEFHAGPPEKAGLWNPDFRPLWCPVPLLAIRHLVSTDFPFLAHDRHFVDAYLARVGSAIPPQLKEAVAEARRYHQI
ncbi:MAG: hypothetical protein K0S28_462 [Paucimonas sp.]|jgi:hypothetical protein|nr:hypothetical protein [Paucimonas sp.]